MNKNLIVAIVAALEGREADFRSSAAGSEIELIDTFAGIATWAFGFKRGLKPKPSWGFWPACQDPAPEARFVVYPGDDRYPVKEGVEAIPLGDLTILLREAVG